MVATVLNSKTSKRQILASLYRYFDRDDPVAMQDLLTLLKTSSEQYLKIMNPNQMTINDVNSKADVITYRQYCKELDKFGFKQHMPILLSMMIKQWPLADINRMLWNIIVLYVRNFGINDEKSNVLTKPFANAVQRVYQGKFNIDLVC